MASGGVYRWTDKTDDRDVPDCLSAVYDYSDKMQLNYSCYLGNEFFGYGEEIMGNEGTIRVMNRQDLYFEAESYNAHRADRPKRARPYTLTACWNTRNPTAPSTTSVTSSRLCWVKSR